MNFYSCMKQYYSVLTNGKTDLEIHCSKYDCGVDPGQHTVAYDGLGNIYIDGIPAHIEIREVE